MAHEPLLSLLHSSPTHGGRGLPVASYLCLLRCTAAALFSFLSSRVLVLREGPSVRYKDPMNVGTGLFAQSMNNGLLCIFSVYCIRTTG